METGKETNTVISSSGVWAEKVYIVTDEYEIKGYVFMPKTGKKNRILSDILNSNKRFVAVKDPEIVHKNNREIKENHEFIQINLDNIVLLRPVRE